MLSAEGKKILVSVLDTLPQPAGYLVPIYHLNRLTDFRVDALNPTALDYMHLPASIIGGTLKDVFPKIEQHVFWKFLNWVSETHSSVTKEMTLNADDIHPLGQMHYAPLEGGVLISAAPTKLQEQTRDFKQLAEQLRQNQALLQSVFDASPNLISVYKSVRDGANEVIDFEFILADARVHAISGEPQLIGKRLFDVFPETRESSRFAAMVRVVNDGLQTEFEHPSTDPSSSLWYRTVIVKLGDGVLMSSEDITERKLAEQERIRQVSLLREAEEQLVYQKEEILNTQRMMTRKDEFISTASHELRTPVTSLKIYTETLLEQFAKKQDPEGGHLLNKLKLHIDRLSMLVVNLLDTTSLVDESLHLYLEPTDLRSLITEKVEEIQRVYPRHHLELHTCSLPPIQADTLRIGQVLGNLLTNAVKYSHPGSQVSVHCEVHEGWVTVSVTDQGIGIPDELKHKIFERFYRVDGAANAKASGLGLGLFISAGIIQQHGGRITVTDGPGGGSCFSFSLPLGSIG